MVALGACCTSEYFTSFFQPLLHRRGAPFIQLSLCFVCALFVFDCELGWPRFRSLSVLKHQEATSGFTASEYMWITSSDCCYRNILILSFPSGLWFLNYAYVGHDWATELNWTELGWLRHNACVLLAVVLALTIYSRTTTQIVKDTRRLVIQCPKVHPSLFPESEGLLFKCAVWTLAFQQGACGLSVSLSFSLGASGPPIPTSRWQLSS